MEVTPKDSEIDERTGLRKKPLSGYCSGLMNHLKCAIGSGIFALGFALKSAGMALGPPILVILGLVQLHCQHMLVQAGREVEKSLGRRPDFAETAAGVFEYGPERMKRMQKFMKIFTNTMLMIHQTGILCIYVVFFANSMQRVATHNNFTSFSIQLWILIALPPILITASTLVNLKVLGYLSLLSNGLILVGILITIYLTSVDVPEELTFEWIGDVRFLPMFISIAILAFTVIQVVLPIYIESKDPEKVTSTFGILNVATIIEVVITILVGVLSYRKYGRDSKGSVTLNFETSALSQTVVAFVGIAIMFTYTPNVYIAVEAMFPLMVDKWGPFRYPRLGIFLFRLGYIIATFILAWTLPMLGQLVALTGAIGNITICVILPTVFHLIITWKDSSKLIKVKDFSLLILGIFCVIAGLIAAILDVIKEIHTVYGNAASSKN